MILSERVPKTISRTSLLVVLLLGVLALPGWSQTGQNENVIPTAQTQNNDTTNRGDDNRGQDDVAAEQEPQKNNAQLDRATILRPGRAQVENPLIHAPNTIDTGSRISDKATRGHSAETNGEIPMLNARANSSKARDARLRQLEKQMQTLISELRSLRLKRSSTAAGELREAAGVEAVGVEAVGVEAAGVNTAAGLAENPNLNFRRPRVSHTRFDGYGTSAIASSPFSDIARKPPSHVVNSRTITLTRTTYRLDRKKGEALAAFLKAQLDVQVTLPDNYDLIDDDEGEEGISDQEGGPGQDTRKLDVNTITIVASPETQDAIGQIIVVMQKSKPKPSRKAGTVRRSFSSNVDGETYGGSNFSSRTEDGPPQN
jgi:hypothetical protein